MAALGRDDRADPTVADHDGLAESGAGGDDREVAPPERARLERHQLVLAERPDAVGRRLQVVQQAHPPGGNRAGEPPLLDHPRQVRGGAAAVHHRPRDADAGRLDLGPRARVEEALDGGLERLEVVARQRDLAHEDEGVAARLEEGERRLGAADVAGEDHATSASPRRCPSPSPGT